MKKRLALLLALLMLTGCTANGTADTQPSAPTAAIDTKEMDFTFTDRELAGSYEVQKAVTITGTGSEITISGSGAAEADGTLLISKAGTYILRGAFTDLCVTIRVGDSGKVQLVLDSADIAHADGPAILVDAADKVFITLPEGTQSSIADGAAYTSSDDNSAPDAAIFSRADLCINGTGSLTVNSQYKHGIVSKDDLVIVGCTLEVTAVSTALDGKDCVKVADAALTLNAGSNGVRSDNAENENRGFVYLRDSTLAITAGNDGIQAETVLQAENAHLTVTAGGGSGYSLRSASGSWKGLKSGGDMLLNGGSYTVSSRDDCIHSNSSIVIAGGTFSLASGDDGVHADSDLTITGGEITISKSYEGLEASKLVIAGGHTSITASDDGLNAAGGADASGMGNRFGRGMFSNGVGEIEISGGYTVVNASGDGIDSNANITVSGGVTLVSGPTSSGNAAFDYDGEATVTGGVLIATGASGMAQNFSAAENQGAMLVTFTQRQGSSIALVDESGRVVASFSPATVYQSAVITAPAVQEGQRYTVVTGGQVEGADNFGFAQDAALSGGTTAAEVTMTSLLYGGGGGHGMWNRPGGGGSGGWHGW